MSSGGGNRSTSGVSGAAHTSVNRDFGSAATNQTFSRPATSTGTNRGSLDANRGNLEANRSDRQANRGERQTSRDVNRDVNRNVNRNVNGNYDIDHDYDDHWHPVASAAAWTAGAAITAAAIGSIVYALPPSCIATTVNGVTYQQCGSSWYQPQFSGTSVSYVVVEAPQ